MRILPVDLLTPYRRRGGSDRWKVCTLDRMRKCLVSRRGVALAKSILIYLANHDVGGVRRLVGQAGERGCR